LAQLPDDDDDTVANWRNFPADLNSADTKCGESKFALFDDRVFAVKFRAMQDKSNKKKPKLSIS